MHLFNGEHTNNDANKNPTEMKTRNARHQTIEGIDKGEMEET